MQVRPWLVIGYRVGETVIKLKKPCQNVSIRLKSNFDPIKLKQSQRKAQLVLSPISVLDIETNRPALVPCIPDQNWPFNEVAATVSRFATEMPKPKRDRAIDFRSFGESFIKIHWPTGVDVNKIPTLNKYLQELSNYTGSRAENLLRVREEMLTTISKGDRRTTSCKGFIKHETYREYKAPRGINSYTDESKTLLCMMCHAIDKRTFESRFFVKGTNPKTWPARLESIFGGVRVVGTDFTAFESHHTGVYAHLVRFWMLHMMRTVPNNKTVKDLICHMTACRNTCSFKYTRVDVDERMMSGALWTSSGNGVLNLLINAYLAADAVIGGHASPAIRAQWASDKFMAVFEGDDGLSTDYGQSQQTIDELGLVLKLERQQDYAAAGFCGIVCERGQDRVLKDPIEVLGKFFWLPGKYGRWKAGKQVALLRAKALSYKYTFGDSPVIGAMCDWVLRQSRDYGEDWQAVHDYFHKILTKDEINTIKHTKARVSHESRLLVESRFGLSIAEQLLIESEFENANSWTILLSLRHHASEQMCQNDATHCVQTIEDFRVQPSDKAIQQGKECFVYKEGKSALRKRQIRDPGPFVLCPYNRTWDSHMEQ